MRRKCSLTLHLIFSTNSIREGLKADNKSVGESVLKIMEDNHFLSHGGKTRGRDGEMEDREEIIVSGFSRVCVCDRERQGAMGEAKMCSCCKTSGRAAT